MPAVPIVILHPMTDLFAPARLVEAELECFLLERPLPANLRRACGYALLGGGKRLRPILTVHACVAAGGAAENALAPAAALEMIHAFSLAHDDLPALDNDDLRRGRPTLHKHAGEAMAILAGDALMGLAFELLAGRAPAATAPALLAELAKGLNDMIAGQVYDTLPEFPEGLSNADKLQLIHRNKTGALLVAACRMGGLAAGADDAALARLTRYGETIGVLYQAVDDLLDATVSTEQMGKVTGKDSAHGKLTFPSVYGVDGTRAEIARMLAEAEAAILPCGARGEPLVRLARFMAHRTK